MENCSHPNIKYDWYQNESNVIINILAKQVKPENVRVDIVGSKLTCLAKLADETDFSLHLILAHDVKTDQLKFSVLSSKIEIRLKKSETILWDKLEASASDKISKEDVIKTYPSSKAPKDWDKLANEIKKEEASEKLEGEAALNQLFQKIYEDGNDETRKAMNKSFLESGGTVLSTSWNEVAAKKVDVKPPDGVEFKKWEE